MANGLLIFCLQKILPPIIKSMRTVPDIMEEYKTEYGYMGIPLHSAVLKARATPQSPATSSSSGSSNSTNITAVVPSGVITAATRPVGQLTGENLTFLSLMCYFRC